MFFKSITKLNMKLKKGIGDRNDTVLIPTTSVISSGSKNIEHPSFLAILIM